MFPCKSAPCSQTDSQPLSCFPPSLFNWEDAVKAVVKKFHAVLAELRSDRRRCGSHRCCGDQRLRGELTLDHVVPRADGGQTRWDNIVAACGPCNTRRQPSVNHIGGPDREIRIRYIMEYK
jgi:hypothetical protein